MFKAAPLSVGSNYQHFLINIKYKESKVFVEYRIMWTDKMFTETCVCLNLKTSFTYFNIQQNLVIIYNYDTFFNNVRSMNVHSMKNKLDHTILDYFLI